MKIKYTDCPHFFSAQVGWSPFAPHAKAGAWVRLNESAQLFSVAPATGAPLTQAAAEPDRWVRLIVPNPCPNAQTVGNSSSLLLFMYIYLLPAVPSVCHCNHGHFDGWDLHV
ncbi:unnamed protein product [Protopolystoma xenopodis]|uniref:Uncharacterized protein n=1 Tax=Protopolystoma xenopodis TaxID=117903 RepID=A0A448X290_9PLAT|nr:unnamed protein product [Protopolystoma xenopodis]